MKTNQHIVSSIAMLLFCGAAAAQSPADCVPSLWRHGTPELGTTLQFELSAAPNCLVANLLALGMGPTQLGPLTLPIGGDFASVPLAVIPASGSPVRGSLAIPALTSLAGLDLFRAAVGVSGAQPLQPVAGPAGRMRLYGTSPTVGEVVLLGEHAFDNGISTIITAAQRLGTTPEFLTNDANAVLTGNPWIPWSARYAGSTVTLPMGGPGNEGMFTFTAPLPFPLADFVNGLVPQPELDDVPGVMPVRNADLAAMVGRTFVAVVFDSAVGLNYDPLSGNLQGERYGRLAFTVVDVLLPGTISESGSSTSFYDLVVRIEAPIGFSAPYGVVPRSIPADSIQINEAIWQNGRLRVSATSALGNAARMLVSVDGFTFDSPMTYSVANAQYEASFVVARNLVGSRVTVTSREGGSYSQTVQ